MRIFRWIRDKIDPVLPAQRIIHEVPGPTTPKAALVKARALIEDDRRWTKGVEARMASGSECSPTSPDAVCFCACGALKAVDAPNAAYKALAVAIASENDKEGHRAILRAFDRAILGDLP